MITGSGGEAGSFLSGGGAVGALMRAHDWSRSPLGDPQTWPQSLRSVVGLLLGSKFPMFVAWGPELGFLYNDAYAEILGAKHPASLGARFYDIWSEIWPDISPLIDAAMAGEATYREDLPLVMNRKGYDEETWFTFSYSPVRDESGGVAGMFCAVQETTDRVLAERRQAAETERQRRMFMQAPGFICTLTGPDHVFDFVNESYRRLFGDRSYIGRSVREVFPDLEGQGFYELLDQVYRTGERYVATAAPARIRLSPDAPEEERFLDFVYAPVMDEAGRIIGLFCEGQDITERRRAEELQRLLLNELNHRVKNTLAVVQGLAHQTFRKGGSVEEARAVFEARLAALSATHDLLTRRSWEAAPLHNIVLAAVEGTVGAAASRVDIRGPDISLAPQAAVSFALAVHELCTNAVKYGALSSESGRIQVRWEMLGEARLRFCWEESGGPRVVPPARRGFGTRLIDTALARELGGEVELDYRPSGVVCTVEAPLPAA
jgi:two-component sensor histidine kinase